MPTKPEVKRTHPHGYVRSRAWTKRSLAVGKSWPTIPRTIAKYRCRFYGRIFGDVSTKWTIGGAAYGAYALSAVESKVFIPTLVAHKRRITLFHRASLRPNAPIPPTRPIPPRARESLPWYNGGQASANVCAVCHASEKSEGQRQVCGLLLGENARGLRSTLLRSVLRNVLRKLRPWLWR